MAAFRFPQERRLTFDLQGTVTVTTEDHIGSPCNELLALGSEVALSRKRTSSLACTLLYLVLCRPMAPASAEVWEGKHQAWDTWPLPNSSFRTFMPPRQVQSRALYVNVRSYFFVTMVVLGILVPTRAAVKQCTSTQPH